MSGSMVLPQPGSVLMSVVRVITKKTMQMLVFWAAPESMLISVGSAELAGEELAPLLSE